MEHQGHTRPVAHQDDVRQQGQAQSGAVGDAVNGGHDRLIKLRHRRGEVAVETHTRAALVDRSRPALAHGLEVTPRAKIAASAAQEHRTDAVVASKSKQQGRSVIPRATRPWQVYSLMLSVIRV